MLNHFCIPKPTYFLSQLIPPEKPNPALQQVLKQLADLYQLGEIKTCYRRPRSKSLNFLVTTARGKFIFRQQRLPEDAVAYEYQILSYLQGRNFPAPRMLLNPNNQAWASIDGNLYSVYEFTVGCCPANFLWLPATKRKIITQCGRTLGEYHQAMAGMAPSGYKWNGYRPTEHKRWCEGDWFWQVLKNIRPLAHQSTANGSIDDFVRSRIDALEQMLKLEPVVEGNAELSKVVIHGDYAPWNIFFRPGQPPFILDFNEARLELKIYDVILATFWFAWDNGRLDQDKALAFQLGYRETGQLNRSDITLAGSVFQWIMARSLIERLYKHYRGQRLLVSAAGMEKQYQMCVFAEQYPQQLVTGLRGMAGA